MVEFCPECEKLMRKKKNEEGKYVLLCASCGFSKPYERKKAGIHEISKRTEKKIIDNKTRVLDENSDNLDLKPRTRVECPKCGNFEAFYEQYQTRSADEPATTFYSCTSCKHRWREY
ncbi:MAG: transcription factor S [Promethearchaeota archaeon]